MPCCVVWMMTSVTRWSCAPTRRLACRGYLKQCDKAMCWWPMRWVAACSNPPVCRAFCRRLPRSYWVKSCYCLLLPVGGAASRRCWIRPWISLVSCWCAPVSLHKVSPRCLAVTWMRRSVPSWPSALKRDPMPMLPKLWRSCRKPRFGRRKRALWPRAPLACACLPWPAPTVTG